ncbi:MAG TPA: dephospho-CoA kinase [Chitinophagales bacterium]|nr:dephospho-CoA kinase [Chitinophagales bacterium]
MLKVGITGGIGSGKTTVCKIFEVLGAPVYYADDRAKELMQTDLKLISEIKALFGSKAYVNGKLNRQYIASKVFSNKPLLAKLNAAVHPEVAKDAELWMSQFEDYPYVLQEAALLFESGWHRQLDKVICVYAPLDVRISRLKARDNATYEEITARMKNQMSDEQKAELSDFVIYNDNKHKLIPQVLTLHHILLDLDKKRG